MCVLFGVCEKPTQQIFINYPIIVSLFTILLRAASSFKQQQWKQIIITPDWLFNTKQRKNLWYILFSLVGWCSLLLTIFVSDYVYLFHQHRRQPPTINQHRWAVSVLKLTSNAGNARIQYCILCSYILPFTQRHSHSRQKKKKNEKKRERYHIFLDVCCASMKDVCNNKIPVVLTFSPLQRAKSINIAVCSVPRRYEFIYE